MNHITTRRSAVINLESRDKLLKKYGGPNQDTKRAIINHLHNNPDFEHRPEEVFEAIRDECRAGKERTVANQLSELSNKEEEVGLEKRTFYHWTGKGRPHPNRRLQKVRSSVDQWLDSLSYSYGTAVFAFLIWALGILSTIGSLVALFTSGSFLGTPFLLWFQIAGLLTILGSSVVMVWIPLYLMDARRPR